MNRITRKFAQLKKQGKKAFIAFITAGDPNLKATGELALAFDKAGVDIVELGVPFSDPMADGPVIQASSKRALDQGTNLHKIFDCVRRIRQKSDIPIALMTYYNPVFHFGEEKAIKAAVKAGVDGFIIPDLPCQEAGDLIKYARKANIATVFFVAPTTMPARIKPIARGSKGFIYYVSLTGVTGPRQVLSKDAIAGIRRVRRMTQKPVCVGFGISTPAQVKVFSRAADGVIVGSAIVQAIEKNIGRRDLVKNVVRFVQNLSCAV
ncbi:MAG: tryptophan synthase subunit alpha [Candidatus Omnitrophica bacterium]|nr:tryptophan synthase subunit alpha [Candidatus Omnitrophota bacterium]